MAAQFSGVNFEGLQNEGILFQKGTMATVFELCLLATAGYTDQEFKSGPRSTFRSLFDTFSFATISSYGGCAKDIQKGERTSFVNVVGDRRSL